MSALPCYACVIWTLRVNGVHLGLPSLHNAFTQFMIGLQPVDPVCLGAYVVYSILAC